ncbi:Biotin synthase (plasmid) [Candidatus Erwinia haradaeae]|uniref:Biotin synthase n=1 Tax=Candidatus Erwinia haradaeae TaxID=1922217 RepID=A0A451DPS8_9GAMM|nr:biotin synthase BioB [Candidatus Erwinia haradaeae]VFP88812.1 Biotin synthase [Candidatus Erwinia haradaeae]
MPTSALWTLKQARALFDKPFFDLLFKAQEVHRQHFKPGEIQVSTLLSIKTGACPEDCKYCPQSARHSANIDSERLIQVGQVLEAARKARDSGSTRFCMGAAWRNPYDRDLPVLEEMIKSVKALGLETCMTLGMLNDQQADRLAKAGLDFYNHNLDTSPEFYSSIVTTRSYQDRLDTLSAIRHAGIKVCSGGIIGLGETINDRAGLLVQLANLVEPPDSIPINMLVKVRGTPLSNTEDVEPFDFIRTIAVARIMMPKSYVRLSAGRESMNDQTQALCFMAGANSVFYGCKLLTTPNPEEDRDISLFNKLGITIERISTNKSDAENMDALTTKIVPIETRQYYNAAG